MIALSPSLDGADQVTAIDELLPFALAEIPVGALGTLDPVEQPVTARV